MKIKIFVSSSILIALLMLSSHRLSNEADKNEVLIKLMMQGLNSSHYNPQKVDDTFSSEVFDLYLKKLDYNKRYFTARDVENLRKFQFDIDEEVNNGTYELFDISVELFNKRVKEAKEYYKTFLDQPFDYSVEESIETDPDKMDFPASVSEAKDNWRKLLKYQTINQLTIMLERQEKAQEKGDSALEIKSFEALEEAARTKVMESYDERFNRLLKTRTSDLRSLYINSIANVYDPHTGYFPPKDKERFDIEMSGRFEGIGARLLEKNGYIEVSEIIPGSPSYRQGELQVGDVIMKVGQEDEEEPVDIVDMNIDDAVLLIRGKKGTEVRLTVRRIDGEIQIIPIIRDEVILEETYAKSVILHEGKSKKGIGYIKLPKFYADFNQQGGPNCAADVAREIEKLKEENMKGLILDLRNNGGGSLQEVIDMTGLFIESGPIVQVKSRGRQPYVLRDENREIQYDGPLIILVNSFSASASEIMAAAIQDYQRGIVIGGTSTFGKGTVQRFLDLDDFIRGNSEIKPLGSMKLTTQKFYRINGGATQLKGVTPDIVLPELYNYLDIREKDQDYPMEWDEIEPVSYATGNLSASTVSQLREASHARIATNPHFDLIDKNAHRLQEQQDLSIYSLNLKKYREERDMRRERAKEFEDKDILIEDLEVSSLKADLSEIQSDSIKIQTAKDWHEDLQKDIYVFEALQVLKDMK